MTESGIIHIFSAVYLSGAICLSVSLYDQNKPGRILRETLRRWLKFLGISLIIAIVVSILG